MYVYVNEIDVFIFHLAAKDFLSALFLLHSRVKIEQQGSNLMRTFFSLDHVWSRFLSFKYFFFGSCFGRSSLIAR